MSHSQQANDNQNPPAWVNRIQSMEQFKREMAAFLRRGDMNPLAEDDEEHEDRNSINQDVPKTNQEMQDCALQVHDALVDYSEMIDSETSYQITRLKNLTDMERNLLAWKILKSTIDAHEGRLHFGPWNSDRGTPFGARFAAHPEGELRSKEANKKVNNKEKETHKFYTAKRLTKRSSSHGSSGRASKRRRLRSYWKKDAKSGRYYHVHLDGTVSWEKPNDRQLKCTTLDPCAPTWIVPGPPASPPSLDVAPHRCAGLDVAKVDAGHLGFRPWTTGNMEWCRDNHHFEELKDEFDAWPPPSASGMLSDGPPALTNRSRFLWCRAPAAHPEPPRGSHRYGTLTEAIRLSSSRT
ncbi:hypothetical protein B0T16DRAFT_461935 [Cercophora newfieldiana]|uniref:WW domain-containing protein n=1 Tax=Cercophora newfieldiana TaxID=92897 RepID=A0AA39XX63_9PEZI|nr:hypothetical protein B0T16DRAFT_461935 [Cercophora newfieldiana]